VPSEKRQRQREAREARLAAEAKAQTRRKQIRNFSIVGVVAAIIVGIVFLVSGNSSKPPKSHLAVGSTTTTVAGSTTTSAPSAADAAEQKAANALAVKSGCPASPSTRVNTQTYATAPPMTINTADLYSATVVTTAGTFEMSLYAKAAPTTVNSFVFLADKGYFHCVIFHRVIPGFMDQTGDPTGTGTGGPGYQFANENIPTAYATGDVAMANSGANTNGSQWFVVVPGGATALNADLSSGGYSLFGSIISGLSVVEKINAEGSAAGVPPDVTQRILSVTIHQSPGV
jgi:peptidyl-prolyl cis-trans isomerase B (cyclophilin B)